MSRAQLSAPKGTDMNHDGMSHTSEPQGLVRAADMIKGSPLHGWHGSFFHSANMTFARWSINTDAADLHEHQHEQEEVWNVVAASIALLIDGERFELQAGDAAVIPPNTPHSAQILGAAEVIVTDYPARSDLPGVGTESS